MRVGVVIGPLSLRAAVWMVRCTPIYGPPGLLAFAPSSLALTKTSVAARCKRLTQVAQFYSTAHAIKIYARDADDPNNDRMLIIEHANVR